MLIIWLNVGISLFLIKVDILEKKHVRCNGYEINFRVCLIFLCCSLDSTVHELMKTHN